MTRGVADRRRALPKNRNFLLLFASQSISAIGDTFSFLALAIRIDSFSSDAGASARALGGIMIAIALPTLLFGIFAGTLVDRWDRRKVMILSDLARAALAPAYLLLRSPGDLPFAFGVAFLMASFSIFFYPARTALLPAIVDEKDLLAANGWMQTGVTISRLVGPALAGIVVAAWGTGIAFWMDGASFLVSGLLVTAVWGVATRAQTTSAGRPSTWQELRAGVRFAARSRLLLGITLGISVAMLGLGAVNVLFVPFLREAFNVGPQALGVIQTMMGAGMLLGGLLMGGLGRRLRPLLVSAASQILLGAGIALFGLAPSYSIELAVMLVIGLSLPPLNAALQTMMQRGIPQEMLGRAGSVMEMAIALTNVVSMGAAGWLGSVIGMRPAFVFGGALVLTGGAAMWLVLRAGLRATSEARLVRKAPPLIGEAPEA